MQLISLKSASSGLSKTNHMRLDNYACCEVMRAYTGEDNMRSGNFMGFGGIYGWRRTECRCCCLSDPTLNSLQEPGVSIELCGVLD